MIQDSTGDTGFKFHDEHGLPLPLLVLAIKCRPDLGGSVGVPRHKFKPGRKFIHLQHQTAGHACHQAYMQATVLRPRDPVRIQLLADAWLESDAGCFGVPLDTVLKYRTQVKDLFGLDCNGCYEDFEEAIYPIDCSSEALKKLCEDDLPEDLDELIQFGDDPLERLYGFIGRWSIYVLGENCD